MTGIMESWYFGNYPCLMSKAAELLSRDRVYRDKAEFLKELAGLYYAEDEKERVVSAWELFEEGYRQYPINVAFSYYGPMHDGVVWELALEPKNFSLPRSWLLTDKTDGDRIGECLFGGHTVEEAVTLFENMRGLWKRGCEILSTLKGWEENANEQFTVVKAIGVLVESAKNILRFYQLRNELGYQRVGGMAALNELRAIVNAEIENSRKMIALCEKDNRLGYHSEAEGYKFFPEKLQARIISLQRLLETEFVRTEKRIASGKAPLGCYLGEEIDSKSYEAGTALENGEWATLSDGLSKFRLAVDEQTLKVEFFSEKKTDFVLCGEFEIGFPSSAILFKNDGRKRMHRDTRSHQSINDERVIEEMAKWRVNCHSEGEQTHLTVEADRSVIGLKNVPFKLMIKTTDRASWCLDEMPVYTLAKSILSPADFGWVFCKK